MSGQASQNGHPHPTSSIVDVPFCFADGGGTTSFAEGFFCLEIWSDSVNQSRGAQKFTRVPPYHAVLNAAASGALHRSPQLATTLRPLLPNTISY